MISNHTPVTVHRTQWLHTSTFSHAMTDNKHYREALAILTASRFADRHYPAFAKQVAPLMDENAIQELVDSLVKRVAEVYAEEFSLVELQDLRQFYESESTQMWLDADERVNEKRANAFNEVFTKFTYRYHKGDDGPRIVIDEPGEPDR